MSARTVRILQWLAKIYTGLAALWGVVLIFDIGLKTASASGVAAYFSALGSGILFWYVLETYLLRVAAQQARRPFVCIQFVHLDEPDLPTDWYLVARNQGSAPAVNVRLETTQTISIFEREYEPLRSITSISAGGRAAVTRIKSRAHLVGLRVAVSCTDPDHSEEVDRFSWVWGWDKTYNDLFRLGEPSTDSAGV